MNGTNGAEPILEVKNLEDAFGLPLPRPLPEASGRGALRQENISYTDGNCFEHCQEIRGKLLMQAGNGAEPILEVKNLKTHLVYPSPGPSRHLYGGHPKHQGGERYDRRTFHTRTAIASNIAKRYAESC